MHFELLLALWTNGYDNFDFNIFILAYISQRTLRKEIWMRKIWIFLEFLIEIMKYHRDDTHTPKI